MKKWDIWTEGYRATGEDCSAAYQGSVEAETFVDACRLKFGHLDYFEVREPIEITSESARLGLARMGLNQDTSCHLWICRLFDNEADARKRNG